MKLESRTTAPTETEWIRVWNIILVACYPRFMEHLSDNVSLDPISTEDSNPSLEEGFSHMSIIPPVEQLEPSFW